jgi:SAM-dependent methyltransferase
MDADDGGDGDRGARDRNDSGARRRARHVSEAVSADSRYTHADHEFRDMDPYARSKYDLTLRWLRRAIIPGSLVYNIGCGSGYFNGLAVERGARVVACEPDPQAFAQAAAREARRAAGAATVLNCGLEEFAHDREPADVVVMHDVLEHMEDDAGAVQLLHRLVRPGGMLIVSVPGLQTLFGLHDEMLGHYRRYEGRQLKRLIERNFTIERFRWFGMASIPIALVFSRWLRRAYPVRTGSSGIIGRAYGAVCAIESRVPEPTGTSITLLARPKNAPAVVGNQAK